MENMFCATDIRYAYHGAVVLRGISFSVAPGSIYVISGRSGCGKSTLLEICSSQRKPDSGQVFWDNVDIGTLNQKALMLVRQNIGVVFQKHALIHNFPVFENIALPLRYHKDLAERELRGIVKACMDEVGLFNVDKKFPNELTVAQAKAAAMARAIVMSPQMLFLDEPTAGLDPITRLGMANVIKDLVKNRGMTVIMVTNDIETMKQLDCPIAILDNGILVDYKSAPDDSGAQGMISTLRNLL